MRANTVGYLKVNTAAVLFALFIVFFPWVAIRGDEFEDVVNYATRIYMLRDFGMHYFIWEDSIFGWLKFEFLWFKMLVFASQMDIHPLVFVKTITAISAFLTYQFLCRYLGIGWSFVVLTNPITIDLLSSQIRSAFAFSLLLTAISFKTGTKLDWLRYPILLLLPFIHSGMILILMICAICWALAYTDYFKPVLKIGATLVAALVVAILVVKVLPTLAEVTEDRRDLALYGSKSAAYLVFWVLCAGALLISYNKMICSRWEYFFAVIFCIMGPLVEIFGIPGFRFVALALPVTFAALTFLTGTIRDGVIIASSLYTLLLYYYWVQ